MGRPRKHPVPRHMFVGASSEKEALERLKVLLGLSTPTRGRAVRVDRLREALAVADSIPPKPPWESRRTHGKPGKKATPAREARAAWRLMDICASRGDPLTVENATRIIEDARTIADTARGITPADRQIIEYARVTLGLPYASGAVPEDLTMRDRDIILQAAGILRWGPTISVWDREFLRLVQMARRDGALNSVIP